MPVFISSNWISHNVRYICIDWLSVSEFCGGGPSQCVGAEPTLTQMQWLGHPKESPARIAHRGALLCAAMPHIAHRAHCSPTYDLIGPHCSRRGFPLCGHAAHRAHCSPTYDLIFCTQTEMISKDSACDMRHRFSGTASSALPGRTRGLHPSRPRGSPYYHGVRPCRTPRDVPPQNNARFFIRHRASLLAILYSTFLVSSRTRPPLSPPGA